MIQSTLVRAACGVAFGVSALSAAAADWWSVAEDIAGASQCDSLDSVPLTFLTSQIDYQSAIQGIFNQNCTMCHTDNDGGSPPADLSLDPGVSWSNIVHHLTSEQPSAYRVLPNQPGLSRLFHKVNCMSPGAGMRMPLGGPYLSLEDQAILSDWILAGAPSTTTDVIFLSAFGPRG